jgi:hypothetical protein
MIDVFFSAVLALNVLWFGAGFHYFSIQQVAAAKVLVPKTSRASPLFLTVAASVRFLGGMNLALAALCLLMLVTPLFGTADQRSALLLVLAIAHGSQVYFNIPIVCGGGRQGEALWDVHRGPMKFIFIGDSTLTVANAALCIVYFAVT